MRLRDLKRKNQERKEDLIYFRNKVRPVLTNMILDCVTGKPTNVVITE